MSMKLIVIAAAALATFSVGVYAAEVDGVLAEKIDRFTPTDVSITPPGADVPKGCAAFSGQWGPGLLPYVGAAVKMVFESIAADCSAVVLVVAAERKSYGNHPGARAERHTVQIVGNSVELKDVTPGSVWTLTLVAPGQRLDVQARNTSTWRSLYFALASAPMTR